MDSKTVAQDSAARVGAPAKRRFYPRVRPEEGDVAPGAILRPKTQKEQQGGQQNQQLQRRQEQGLRQGGAPAHQRQPQKQLGAPVHQHQPRQSSLAPRDNMQKRMAAPTSQSSPARQQTQNHPRKSSTPAHRGASQPTKSTPQHKSYVSAGSKSLKVIFLGGVGEIGKNMTLLECGDDILVIDSGLAFPDEYMPGIDLVIPDMTYLKQNVHKVRGVIVTHGHEDHIGSLPYLMRVIGAPVYGSRLTVALLENKMTEHQGVKMKAIPVKARDKVQLGCFGVEFIKVNHSIAGSFALAITTPCGNVIHTGDFKIDYTPIEKETTDLPRLAEYGNRGVLLMLGESTNVGREGFTMSESTVGDALAEIFEQQKDKRIIVTTFATNTYRLQQVFDLCEKFKRKVAFTGRSMVNICDTAIKLGELQMNKNNLIEIEKVSSYKDSEICILTTGSQGEPMSALTRMSTDEFAKFKLSENDCVIFSSSPIPGNEKTINRVVNALYKKGVTVINDELADTHVSGHACKEELKIVHKLVKPRYFIPVHGEYKHLKQHEALALSMGMNQRDIFLPDIGYVVEVTKDFMKFAGVVPSGINLVDGLGVGDAESVVLKDRLQLAEDGLCVCVVGLNSTSGEILTGPDLISRGLIYAAEIGSLIGEAKEVVANTIKGISFKDNDMAEVKNTIRRSLQNYFFKKTKRRPMVLTIIIES